MYASICDIQEIHHLSYNSGFWRTIWNLKIPLKIKYFIWHVKTKCLPTKEQLSTKHVDLDIRYLVCNLALETTVHALIECSFVVSCWVRFGLQFDTLGVECFLDWMREAV